MDIVNIFIVLWNATEDFFPYLLIIGSMGFLFYHLVINQKDRFTEIKLEKDFIQIDKNINDKFNDDLFNEKLYPYLCPHFLRSYVLWDIVEIFREHISRYDKDNSVYDLAMIRRLKENVAISLLSHKGLEGVFSCSIVNNSLPIMADDVIKNANDVIDRLYKNYEECKKENIEYKLDKLHKVKYYDKDKKNNNDKKIKDFEKTLMLLEKTIKVA